MSETTKILIVDDDPDIRNVLNLLLRSDYETAEAADGFAAVEYIQQNPETDLRPRVPSRTGSRPTAAAGTTSSRSPSPSRSCWPR